MSLPRMPSFVLDRRRALVTGASSGIGVACAAALAGAGAHVTIAARSSDRLAEVLDELRGVGAQAEMLVMDVADIEATAHLVAEGGPFDILVNSAGIAKHTPAIETTSADFDAVTGINLRGAYFLTQSVARGLLAIGRPGSLINISSQMGQVGGMERALYCATKHGVEGFTKAMAMEWGPAGIRVNTVCPTFIRTPLTESTFSDPQRAAWIRDKIKLGRVGELQDVMGAVLYLASDASSLVTGTALMVDGGWTAG